MKNHYLWLCLLFFPVKGNFSVINKTENDVQLVEQFRGPKHARNLPHPKCYRIEPGATQVISNRHEMLKDSDIFVHYFANLGENTGADAFKFPDDEYGAILKKGSYYMPIFVITHDPVTNGPILNMPRTTQELKDQIAAIKNEALSSIKKEVKNAAPELPGGEGGIVGLIGEYAVEE